MLALGACGPLALHADGRLAPRRPQLEVRSAVPSMAAGDKKIVVTGLGVLSALGSGDDFWNGLGEGKCGIDAITHFDASKYPTTIGAEVKDFDPKPYFASPKTVKSTDRFTHMAVAASKMALEDAGVDMESVNKKRFGCIVGTAFGGMDTLSRGKVVCAPAFSSIVLR